MRRAPTRFSSSPTLRLTADLGIARCLAAAVKLPVSTTAAKTTIAFRSGPWWLTVLLSEQSFPYGYSSPIGRTMADLAHDTQAHQGARPKLRLRDRRRRVGG